MRDINEGYALYLSLLVTHHSALSVLVCSMLLAPLT